MNENCGTCKHWDQEELRTGWKNALDIHSPGVDYEQREELARRLSLRFGHCHAIPAGWDLSVDQAEQVRAVAWDGSQYRADVCTRDDFGCVLHVAAPVDLPEATT